MKTSIAIREAQACESRRPIRTHPDRGASTVRDRPLLSIVVPTKNERGNIAELIERLEAVLPTVAMEIIFVDASSDGTAESSRQAGGRCQREVVLLHQTPRTPAQWARRRRRPGPARRTRRPGSASWTPTFSIRPS